MLRFTQTGCNAAREGRGRSEGWTPLERCWTEVKVTVTKQKWRRSANLVACLCHQHPVGTTDVPMMSCGKGIGREGGATGAREDRGGRGLALRDGEGGSHPPWPTITLFFGLQEVRLEGCARSASFLAFTWPWVIVAEQNTGRANQRQNTSRSWGRHWLPVHQRASQPPLPTICTYSGL